MYIVTKEVLLKLAIEGYTEIKTIVIVCGDKGVTFKEEETTETAKHFHEMRCNFIYMPLSVGNILFLS